MRFRFESLPISFRYKHLALCETKSGIHPLSGRLAGSKYKQNLDSGMWSEQKLSKKVNAGSLVITDYTPVTC